MPFKVLSDPGTERLRDELGPAVQSALGPAARDGDWVLQIRKRDRGYLVDLANRDGMMRQWLFDADDPIVTVIRQDLSHLIAVRS